MQLPRAPPDHGGAGVIAGHQVRLSLPGGDPVSGLQPPCRSGLLGRGSVLRQLLPAGELPGLLRLEARLSRGTQCLQGPCMLPPPGTRNPAAQRGSTSRCTSAPWFETWVPARVSCALKGDSSACCTAPPQPADGSAGPVDSTGAGSCAIMSPARARVVGSRGSLVHCPHFGVLRCLRPVLTFIGYGPCVAWSRPWLGRAGTDRWCVLP